MKKNYEPGGCTGISPSVLKLLVTMKLMLLLICGAGLLSSFGKSYAQNTKLSVELKNSSIEDVLNYIEVHTEYSFMYDNKKVDVHREVDIAVKDQTVETILDQLFGNEMKYQMVGRHIIISPKTESSDLVSTQQSGTISGRVTDSSGAPLPGVTVMLKGTTQGTITDVEGNYILPNVPGDGTLVFSFVGMKAQEVKVSGKTYISIEMTDETLSVDEVVVVGYGTQKKVTVTGSISSINGEQLKKAPVGNISTLLAGRLPGLVTYQSSGAPGYDDAAMYIRGRSTSGNSSPTIIVDGVQRSFNNLDPNEIADITILKDASAAAVYGVQGANGVILVTTRRGTSKAPRISYSTSLSVNKNTRFPEFLDGPQYAHYYNKAREMDGLPVVFSEADIDKITNGDPDGIFGNTNWVDELFSNNGLTKHHNLSLEGGNEKTRYFVLVGYYDQEGSIKNYSFERYNLRSNIDTKVANNLTLRFDMAARLEKRSRPFYGTGKNDWNGLVQQAIRAHPFIPMYTVDGNPTAARTGSSIVNPIAGRDLAGRINRTSPVFQSNVSLTYDVPFIKGLSLNTMVGYDRDYFFEKIFNMPYKLQVFDLATKKYQEQWAPNAASGLAQLTDRFDQGERLTIQSSMTYAKSFSNGHEFKGLLLYEQSSRATNEFKAVKRDFDFTDLPELDFGKEVPKAEDISGNSGESPRAGFVGRINYSYKEKYLVELAARYDGSYKFHKDHRWGFFPAMSLAWRLSEEEFFKNALPAFDNFKLRASVGKLGNDQINEYLFLNTMKIDQNSAVIGGTLQNSIYTASIPNISVTWETTTTYNIGFDSQFWKGLLGIEFDWFYKKTVDILKSQSGSYPPSIGGNFPSIVNLGIVDNRGFDFSITYNKRAGNFSYGAKLNMNWARNRIIKTDDSPNAPDYVKLTGRSVDGKHGLVSLGLFKSDEEALMYPSVVAGVQGGDIRHKDLNGDGKINYDQDRTWIGKSNVPELVFGLNLFAGWKNFDFTALIQGGAIADIALMGFYPNVGYSDTEFTRPFYGGGNTPLYLVQDSWTYDNPEGKYPRLTTLSRVNNAWASTFWIKDASYARLKNVQLGYNFPKKLVRKVGIQDLRMYVSGMNLITISGLKYLDPEAPDVNNGYYPQQMTFTMGLNLAL